MNNELFLKIEREFSVSMLCIEDVSYWPVLKNIIYFRDRKVSSNIVKSIINSPNIVFSKVIEKIKRKLGFNRTIAGNLNYQSIDILFSGTISHRENINKKSFNRYFDPIMNEIEATIKTGLYEYDFEYDSIDYYKRNRLNFISQLYGQVTNRIITFTKIDEDFIGHVANVFNIPAIKLKQEIENALVAIKSWEQVWNNILEKTSPKVVMVLCYYSLPMYGLMLAANKKRIKTIDMQHGGQGENHPAYTFHNFPTQGFNVLPYSFWVWDLYSKKHLESVFLNTKTIILGGNPWLKFQLDTNKTLLSNNRKKIICTLTLGKDIIFPNYLQQAIKESSLEYEWYLRFHPRTSASDKKHIQSLVSSKEYKGKVNIGLANEISLPILLTNAYAHVSHSSGSLSEAFLLGLKRNIITSKIGLENFNELVKNQDAYYFDETKGINLLSFINSIKFQNGNSVEFLNSKDIITKLINEAD